ncbi:hypothetical protein CLOM_g9872, partial [Closterium sp. NIES-68]
LRKVNNYLDIPKFKYEGLAELIRPGDWMFSIDLKSGYHHVEIHPSCWKFLGFPVRRRLLFLHIAPVRACHCPVRLHTTDQTTGKAMAGKRRAGCSICRRLTIPLQLPLGCTLDLRSCCSGPEGSRFCYKRQKVTSTPLAPDSFPRLGD